jgi:hypothetical protein
MPICSMTRSIIKKIGLDSLLANLAPAGRRELGQRLQ